MRQVPTQYEVKSLFSLVIPRGAGKQIALDMNVTEGDWSRRANPNDERKLATAEALREQLAIIENCPDEWPTIRAYIETLWDEWETQGKLPVPSAAQVAKEHHDYVTAELQNAPPCRKGMELAQSIAVSKRRLMALESDGVLRKVV